MGNLTENQKRDYQLFFKEAGDPGFSPERNKAVIDGTIAKYEAMRLRKRKDYVEQIKERADAVGMYLRSRAADSNRPIDAYLSRRELARLQGRKIVEKIKRLANGKQVVTIESL